LPTSAEAIARSTLGSTVEDLRTADLFGYVDDDVGPIGMATPKQHEHDDCEANADTTTGAGVEDNDDVDHLDTGVQQQDPHMNF
jgi:hypothetical protein